MWNGYCDWGDEDFRLFEEAYSATSRFPLGPVRQRWSADALQRQDQEYGPSRRDIANGRFRKLKEY
jgi:hypothetical protein